MTDHICSKCSSKMDQGYVLDYAPNAIAPQRWHSGIMKKSRWLGTKRPSSRGLVIVTYRCQQCGYLESYANADQEPK